MRATINGITLEGTPEEIAEYTSIQAKQQMTKPIYDQVPNASWWLNIKPVITSGETNSKKSCPSMGQPCYCTGACM